MSMFEEFKKFALKGNAVDMAVGVIIGGAFGTIVTSLVNDVIMPPLGLLLGKVDFSELVLQLNSTVGDAKPVVIRYGAFINNCISFLIVAFTLFIVIRQMNRIHIPFIGGSEETPAPTTKECPYCCSTIPIHATRCPECTSEVPVDGAVEAKQEI